MIYADHAATTPCLPEVVAVMVAALESQWGNPTSRHPHGRRALAAMDLAREQVAGLIGARADAVVFTSGATEALNLAILGLGERLLRDRPKVVVAAGEHSAVRLPLRRLAEAGAEVVEIPIDGAGRLDHDRLAREVDARTGLVCAMLANNETGVIHDLAAIAAVARRHRALTVCDATAALGKMPIDVVALGCDALVATAHKCYGPQGAGFLWLRSGIAPAPQIHGGGHERGLRAGTPAVPAIAGLGACAAAAARDLDARRRHLGALTVRLESALREALPDLRIHGASNPRIPGTMMLTLPGLPRGWLAALPGVAASGGSACVGTSGSSTLLAMGVATAEASNAIRLSLGIATTPAEVDAIAAAVIRAASALREQAVNPSA